MKRRDFLASLGALFAGSLIGLQRVWASAKKKVTSKEVFLDGDSGPITNYCYKKCTAEQKKKPCSKCNFYNSDGKSEAIWVDEKGKEVTVGVCILLNSIPKKYVPREGNCQQWFEKPKA